MSKSNGPPPPAADCGLSRRAILGALGSLTVPLLVGVDARAQNRAVSAAALPVATTFIEHLGTVVPDVAAATAFHSRLFNPAIMREAQPPLRCYVQLSPGYLAFGSRANASRAFFDHFCVLLKQYDPAALAARLEAEGTPSSPRFTLFPDPDGTGVQLYQDPGGWFPTVVPGDPYVTGPSLVTPHGLEHVILNVADVAVSTTFYRRWFGPLDTRESADLVWFEFAGTRLGLRRTPSGATPGIDHIRVRVAPFDHGAVRAELERMGATVAAANVTDARVLQFQDPMGLKLELLAT